jgi:hypothetical protein
MRLHSWLLFRISHVMQFIMSRRDGLLCGTLVKISLNLHESFLTLYKSNFVKTMATGGWRGHNERNCFTFVYVRKIFLSPRTITCERDIYVASFLAHLSWKLKWAILIAFCPLSVCLSVRPFVCPSVCKLLHFRLLP